MKQQIHQGESRTLEFKKELPADSSKWVKTIVAFANGAGGKENFGYWDSQRSFKQRCSVKDRRQHLALL